MSTYSYTDPSSSPKDAVRFLVGDTKGKQVLVDGQMQTQYLLSDEEIAYCLSQTGNDPQQAAVLACESIISGLGQLCDQTVGSVSKSFSQMRDGFASVLALLRRRSSFSGGRPILGGTSRMGKRQTYADPDFIRTQFTARMMNARGTLAPLLPGVWGEGYGPDADPGR